MLFMLKKIMVAYNVLTTVYYRQLQYLHPRPFGWRQSTASGNKKIIKHCR